MSFLDWMSMSMFIDISFVVFFFAVIWRFRKTQKQLRDLQNSTGNVTSLTQKLEILEARLNQAIKNPAVARRNLKSKQ